jgi:hypothetical protein
MQRGRETDGRERGTLARAAKEIRGCKARFGTAGKMLQLLDSLAPVKTKSQKECSLDPLPRLLAIPANRVSAPHFGHKRSEFSNHYNTLEFSKRYLSLNSLTVLLISHGLPDWVT